MPRFEYFGRSSKGKEVKGIIDGVDENAVALELTRSGVTPISIELYLEKKPLLVRLKAYIISGEPSVQDLTFFCRQLYTLLKSGVPIIRAIKVVLDSAKNVQLKLALIEIMASIEAGQSLTMGLKQHPDVFPGLMGALVRVGEDTGGLSETFRQLAVHFDKELKTRKQIASALRYPIVVIIVIIISVTIVNLVVIPAFANFFAQFKTELPLPTRILIAVSNFFVHYWYLVFGGLIGSFVLFFQYIKTNAGHYQWDKIKLKIPLIGRIMLLALLARFSRSFALSSRSGVPLLESITMISKTTDNLYIADKISIMREHIERGESITNSAFHTGIFTPLIIQMFSVGEETGEIDKLLDQVADYYEEEVDYNVQRLGDAIEPILIGIIAVFVLMLALGIFLPMWDLWKVAVAK